MFFQLFATKKMHKFSHDADCYNKETNKKICGFQVQFLEEKYAVLHQIQKKVKVQQPNFLETYLITTTLEGWIAEKYRII